MITLYLWELQQFSPVNCTSDIALSVLNIIITIIITFLEIRTGADMLQELF